MKRKPDRRRSPKKSKKLCLTSIDLIKKSNRSRKKPRKKSGKPKKSNSKPLWLLKKPKDL